MEGVQSDQIVANGHVSTVEEKFQAALNVIQNLPKNGSYKPSHEMMLKFYSYYKQATEGPCTKPKPWAWDIINKAKWDAWSKLGSMSKSKAMEQYVESLKLIMKEAPPISDDEIVEAMPATDNVQKFIQILGDFYEVVELEPPNQFKKFSGSMSSTPMKNGDVANSNGEHQKSASRDFSSSESENDDMQKTEDAQTGHHSIPVQSPKKGEHMSEGSERQSDSEDEFCDTAEDVHDSESALQNGVEGMPQSSDQSSSISTLQSTSASSSYQQNDNDSASDTVRINSWGGEYGSRGSDGIMQTNKGQTSNQHYSGRNSLNFNSTSSPSGGATSDGSGGRRGPHYTSSEVQDQIATTLMQLQQDMKSVLNRLTILETITVDQKAQSSQKLESPSEGIKRRLESQQSPWPFNELSPKTVLFIVAWPFFAKLIMNFLNRKQLKR